ISSISDASIPFHPGIDEPSNAWPLSSLSSSTAVVGTDTWCSRPIVSVKRKSTNLTSLSAICFRISFGLAMSSPFDKCAGGQDLHQLAYTQESKMRARLHYGSLMPKSFLGAAIKHHISANYGA